MIKIGIILPKTGNIGYLIREKDKFCLEFNIEKGNESTTIIDEKRLF